VRVRHPIFVANRSFSSETSSASAVSLNPARGAALVQRVTRGAKLAGSAPDRAPPCRSGVEGGEVALGVAIVVVRRFLLVVARSAPGSSAATRDETRPNNAAMSRDASPLGIAESWFCAPHAVILEVSAGTKAWTAAAVSQCGGRRLGHRVARTTRRTSYRPAAPTFGLPSCKTCLGSRVR
jgi:hypothetical protein